MTGNLLCVKEFWLHFVSKTTVKWYFIYIFQWTVRNRITLLNLLKKLRTKLRKKTLHKRVNMAVRLHKHFLHHFRTKSIYCVCLLFRKLFAVWVRELVVQKSIFLLFECLSFPFQCERKCIIYVQIGDSSWQFLQTEKNKLIID